jgi:uncharacterized protein
MKFRFDGYNHIVRLSKGEKLIESLTKLAKDQQVPSCWINGLGGAQEAELGFYNLDTQEYNWQKIEEPMEITSLQGNLTWVDQEPAFHIHGTFAKTDLSAIGGHVREVIVSGTCEVFLHRWYGDNLTKSIDPDTGLKLLNL